jgi:hypothetical protein
MILILVLSLLCKGIVLTNKFSYNIIIVKVGQLCFMKEKRKISTACEIKIIIMIIITKQQIKPSIYFKSFFLTTWNFLLFYLSVSKQISINDIIFSQI